MAATTSEYRTIPFESKRGTVTTVNLRAIPTAVESVLKSRFYLDRVFVQKDKDGNEAFIGLCIEGGANYLMHNPDRLGSLRFYIGGLWHVAWKDAGLNTKGISTKAVMQDQGVITASSGNITFKSSWWNNTIKYGVRYRQASGTWKEINSSTSLAQRETKTESFHLSGLKSNLGGELYSFLLNEEGEYRSETIPFIVFAEAASVFFSVTDPVLLCAGGGTALTVYFNSFPDVGTIVYSDPNGNTPAANGYYKYGDFVYRQQGGVIVGKTQCAPPSDIRSRTYIMYSANKFTACNLEDGDSLMYYKFGVDKHYYDMALTQLVANGYYAFKEGGVTKVWNVNNGFIVGTENC